VGSLVGRLGDGDGSGSYGPEVGESLGSGRTYVVRGSGSSDRDPLITVRAAHAAPATRTTAAATTAITPATDCRARPASAGDGLGPPGTAGSVRGVGEGATLAASGAPVQCGAKSGPAAASAPTPDVAAAASSSAVAA